MPKVSVVIPCYNYAHFLPEAVESVIRQTYKDFEIIIVDDGSRDNTAQVAGALINKYPSTSITLIKQENSGVSAARNNGIKIARGEYIQPLDADDILLPDFLKDTVAVLDAHRNIDIVFTGESFFDRSPDSPGEPKVGSMTNPSCCLFRKRAHEAVGGYKDIFGEDYEFWCALRESGHMSKFMVKPLCLYREHESSRSHSVYKIKSKEHAFLPIKKLHPKLFSPRILHPFGIKIMHCYIYLSFFLKVIKINRLEILFRKKIVKPLIGIFLSNKTAK